MLKDEMLAEDAVQEILMKILLNMSKFSGKSKFSTWIYSISYNYCIDYIRRQKKRDRLFTKEPVDIKDEGGDEIDDKLLLETKIENLKLILEEIPVQDKAVLLMKYQDGMSIRDMSSVLEKTESAIKMKIKRAKMKFIREHERLFANAS
jgi:RNA polymerase sigma-70 factor (ECF subfamily)